jgi:multidrug efflux pump subunit AcrA (membrane-fusion protein)
MADMSSLEVEADVSESNITRVKVGQPCEIALDAYPEIRYQGFVHKIVPTADRAKATVLTKVRFKQKDERVLPEMSAKVLFLEKEISNEEQHNIRPLLTVPTSSVILRDDKSVAFKVRDERAEVVSVITGAAVGTRVEILEGLTAGEKIILHPPRDLTTGDRVRIKGN